MRQSKGHPRLPVFQCQLPPPISTPLIRGIRVDFGGRKWYQSKCRPRIPIRLLCTLLHRLASIQNAADRQIERSEQAKTPRCVSPTNCTRRYGDGCGGGLGWQTCNPPQSANGTAYTPLCLVIEADLIYNHTRYDVTSGFWVAFIEVRKPAENDAADGFEKKFLQAGLSEDHEMFAHIRDSHSPQTCWI